MDEMLEKLRKEKDFTIQLKDAQREALTSLLEGKDTCAFLPTGYGKSLIFMLFPLLLDSLGVKRHIALVVSPLKAVMRNLELEYSDKGFSVVHITDNMDASKIAAVQEGSVSVVLITPEALQQDSGWRKVVLESPVYQDRVSLLVVDEAHAVLEWNSFREAYQNIGDVRAFFKVPLLLTTATVTPELLDQMLAIFNLRQDEVTMVSRVPDRPNIYLEYRPANVHNPIVALAEYIGELRDLGVKSRKAVIYTTSMTQLGMIYQDILGNPNEKAFAGGVMQFNHKMISVFHAEVYNDRGKRLFWTVSPPQSQ